MKNADMPAMPVERLHNANGFSKREEIAVRLASSILSSGDVELANLIENQYVRSQFASGVAAAADALLAALEGK